MNKTLYRGWLRNPVDKKAEMQQSIKNALQY